MRVRVGGPLAGVVAAAWRRVEGMSTSTGGVNGICTLLVERVPVLTVEDIVEFGTEGGNCL
jgi:hypothetical protein